MSEFTSLMLLSGLLGFILSQITVAILLHIDNSKRLRPDPPDRPPMGPPPPPPPGPAREGGEE